MPENTLTESGQTAGDPQASGNSAEGDSSTSFDPLATFNSLKDLPEFQSFVGEIAGRQAQSVKDKRIQKIETKQDGFSDQLARYNKLTAGGLSEEVAIEFMGLLQGQDAEPASDPNAVVGNLPAPQAEPPQEGVDYQSILGAMGLNLGDATVAKVLVDHPADLSAQMKAFAGLSSGNAQQTQGNVSQGSVLPLETQGRAPDPNLQAQYDADVAKVRQGDMNTLMEVKEAYRKKGLDIL